MKSILLQFILFVFLRTHSLQCLLVFTKMRFLVIGYVKILWPGYSAFEMIRYKKDGTWNSFGELIVDFPVEENKVKVFYSALGSGVWEIEGQNLISMINPLKLEIEIILGLKSILACKMNLN